MLITLYVAKEQKWNEVCVRVKSGTVFTSRIKWRLIHWKLTEIKLVPLKTDSFPVRLHVPAFYLLDCWFALLRGAILGLNRYSVLPGFQVYLDWDQLVFIITILNNNISLFGFLRFEELYFCFVSICFSFTTVSIINTQY